MNLRSSTVRWKVLMALVLVLGLTQLAAAGTVPPVPTGPLDANGQPATPDYYTTANWANSPPLAKFVDTLPGLGPDKANALGQYLSIAKPDVTTYPGSDYYEIELVEYQQRLHSDLPAPGTKLRGYRQVNKGTNLSPGTLPSENKCGPDKHACTAADTVNGVTPDPVRYLGGTIISERDRPVRVKFINRLPAGNGGKLFIPVDTTVMGAGTGPAAAVSARGQAGAACDNTIEPNSCASYPENRADLHLHGGRTPWISDGTPHQWVTPVEEITPFTKGASYQNVPDMADPGDGAMTYYWTNQQSARLMFYHDHAFGITRLNVYVGEAAGYLITDKWEQDLVKRGVIPPDQIPLVIQDKTFVDATPVTNPANGQQTTQVRLTDPLWNWGSGDLVNGVRTPVTGDLWLPHVYMPAQMMVAGKGGVNPFGRWMYGPWFYPATVIEKGPLANPYYDQDCSSPFKDIYAKCSTPGQPPQIPGTPHPSMGMEAFHDTMLVNGTAFPSLTVDPRAYRFRILNAANDRFQNLSFYVADPTQVSPDTRPASRLTEVKTVPASADLAALNSWPANWPVDGREGGVPDPAFKGPSFLQIGTEGGFLPQPVTIEPQPITYITDPTAFWVGNVDKMGLGLGPAERADVIVDFSAYAGKTLILYNDAPAAWPAGVATYDYYTGAPDQRDAGGYGAGGTWDPVTKTWVGGHGTSVGYGPNTRTVMQVIVRPTVGTDAPYSFDPVKLAKEFTFEAPVTDVNPAPTQTLFERAQEPIIVGQDGYSAAYPNSYFPPNFPWEGISQINDKELQFVTVAGEPVVIPMEPKGIHDEMGASFDPVYGRMSGNLGMQLPNPTTLNALLVLYGYSDLPTELIQNSAGLNVEVLPGSMSVADGTQIWKISHNGVDTHPIHFHIFDVQLINRVGWDGQILFPEPNEMGWKDTVKISPLEDTIVAVRPRAPLLPFGIPTSKRHLNPALPDGTSMGFNQVDWQTGNNRATPVTNTVYDFGWEYVWHCHILSHEEMDMMRPIVLNVPTAIPPAPDTAGITPLTTTSLQVNWTDPTPVNYLTGAGFGEPTGEQGFTLERSLNGGSFSVISSPLANSTSYIDTAVTLGDTYSYRLTAHNASGTSGYGSEATITLTQVDAPGSITVPGTTSTDGTLSADWTASATGGVTYVLEEANNSGFTGAVEVYRGTALASGTLTGHLSGSYYFRVKAIKSGMVDSVWTVSSAAIVDLPNVAASTWIWTPATSTNGSFYATWDASATPGVTYVAEEANNASFTGSVEVYRGTALRSAPVGGHSAGTWYMRVKAIKAGMDDSVWMVSTGTTVVPPAGAPTGITVPAVSYDGTFNATWGASATSGVTYVVEEADNASFTATREVYRGTGLSSPLVTGHAPGTWYMRVKAIKSGQPDSAWVVSTPITVTVGKPAWIWTPASSTDGFFWATWGASATSGVTYVAEEADNINFTGSVEVYRGTALRSSSVGGHAPGTWYMRVKAIKTGVTDSPWVVSTGLNVMGTVAQPGWIWTPASSADGYVYATWGASATTGVTYVVEEANNLSFTGAVQVYSGTNLRSTPTGGHTSGTWYLRVKAIKAGMVDSGWVVSTGCVTGAMKPGWVWTPATSTGTLYATWGASSTANVTYVAEEANNPSFTGAVQVYSGTALRSPQTYGHAPGTWYIRVKATAPGYPDSQWVSSTGCTIP